MPQRLARLDAVTTRTSRCRTCRGTSWPARSSAVGADVRGWAVGDRVTVPFVCACGACPACLAGDQQVCDGQTQPGLHALGLVRRARGAADTPTSTWCALPDELSTSSTAAALGCRFATAYRAVVAPGAGARRRVGRRARLRRRRAVGGDDRGRGAARGSWRSTCAGARSSWRGRSARRRRWTPGAIAPPRRRPSATGGGAHVSLDALGSAATCAASVRGLRRRGRHVQVGLLLGDGAAPAGADGPGDRAASWRCSAATAWRRRLSRDARAGPDGSLDPDRLLRERIGLAQAPRGWPPSASREPGRQGSP